MGLPSVAGFSGGSIGILLLAAMRGFVEILITGVEIGWLEGQVEC